MEWVHTPNEGHTTLGPGKVGFMYMLAGGTDASNTDPAASKPLPDNHWIKTGPHVMMVGAGSRASTISIQRCGSGYLGSLRDVGGTPYQHLMIPVK